MLIWWIKTYCIPVQLIVLRSPFSLPDFVLPPKMLAAALFHPKSKIAIQSQLLLPLKCHLQFAEVFFFRVHKKKNKKIRTDRWNDIKKMFEDKRRKRKTKMIMINQQKRNGNLLYFLAFLYFINKKSAHAGIFEIENMQSAHLLASMGIFGIVINRKALNSFSVPRALSLPLSLCLCTQLELYYYDLRSKWMMPVKLWKILLLLIK